MNTFEQSAADFARFAETQGYPASLSWTMPDDLMCWRRRLFVRLVDPEARRLQASASIEAATARNTGLSIEGKCKTQTVAICRIYVPEDDMDAQYRMIPKPGMKLTVVVEPLPVVVVKSRAVWWLLKQLVRTPILALA